MRSTRPGLGTECLCRCYRCYHCRSHCPRLPPGRLLCSHSPLLLLLSPRSQYPSPSHNVRFLSVPRSPPPPRQDPPTREIPTVSASSPRSTRPPSWNNLHRHTASDPSPSPREGRGATPTRRTNPTALRRMTDNTPLSRFYFLSDDEITDIPRRLQCHFRATLKCATPLNSIHSFISVLSRVVVSQPTTALDHGVFV